MFINVETRKKLCRLGKKLKLNQDTKKDGEWLIQFFSPLKPGRPKQIITLTK